MQLRKGKTKTLLESSIDCALLSVDIYNKPRTPFRVESFITHMIMSWTRLLQAYFGYTNKKYRKIYKTCNSRFAPTLKELSIHFFIILRCHSF